MRRRAGFVLSVVALAVLGSVSGCGGGDGRGGAARPGVGASGRPQEALDGVAARVETVARDRFAFAYAGLRIRGGGLVVYRRPAAGFDDAVRRAAGDVRISYQDAPYSASELQVLRARVEADVGYWSARGVPVSTVSVRVDGSAVEVGTSAPELARREFPRRYGARPPTRIVQSGPISPAST